MRIFLLGFMGTGKSHWGELWAKAHRFQFIDLDQTIVQQEQESITAIFENKGEYYFRQKETEALRSLIGQDNCIISCGGGTPCFFNNMQWMNENGLTVFLEASPKYILNNVKNEKTQRPLLKKITNDAELLSFIEEQLKQRKQFYLQAQIILPAEELDMESIKNIIAYSK